MTLLRLNPAMGTHRGMRRKHNEDAIGYEYPTTFDQLQEYGAIFVVADGVGGLEDGEQASHLAVDLMPKEYYATDAQLSTEARLVQAVQAVNTEVFAQHKGKSATTLIAAVITGEHLVAVSVGDSMIYHLWGDQMTRINELDVQAYGPKQEELLTKALGYRETLTVEPIKRLVAPGDALLLCSDGLSRYVDRAQIRRMAGIKDPREAVSKMIDTANKAGGADNVSAALIQIGSPIDDDEVAAHIEGLDILVKIDAEPIITLAAAEKPQTHIPTSRPEPALPPTPVTTTPPPPKPDTREQLPTSIPVSEKQPQSNMMLIWAGVAIILVSLIILGRMVFAPASTEAPTPVQHDGNANLQTQNDASIQIGDRITLEQALASVMAIGEAQVSLMTEPGVTYLVEESAEDSEGQLWYRLLDENSGEGGWVKAEDLSP